MKMIVVKPEIVEKCLNNEKIMHDMGVLFKTTPPWTKRKVKDQNYLTGVNALGIIKKHLHLTEAQILTEIEEPKREKTYRK